MHVMYFQVQNTIIRNIGRDSLCEMYSPLLSVVTEPEDFWIGVYFIYPAQSSKKVKFMQKHQNDPSTNDVGAVYFLLVAYIHHLQHPEVDNIF